MQCERESPIEGAAAVSLSSVPARELANSWMNLRLELDHTSVDGTVLAGQNGGVSMLGISYNVTICGGQILQATFAKPFVDELGTSAT
jgi:hypothetical protein